MSVYSKEDPHPAGAGIYYHVDYVGVPRAYKWINTINLAKSEYTLLTPQSDTERLGQPGSR